MYQNHLSPSRKHYEILWFLHGSVLYFRPFDLKTLGTFLKHAVEKKLKLDEAKISREAAMHREMEQTSRWQNINRSEMQTRAWLHQKLNLLTVSRRTAGSSVRLMGVDQYGSRRQIENGSNDGSAFISCCSPAFMTDFVGTRRLKALAALFTYLVWSLRSVLNMKVPCMQMEKWKWTFPYFVLSVSP